MATPTLNPKITNAGLAIAPSPEQPGLHVTLTHVALGTGKYAPTGSETALQNEVARYQIGSGTSPNPRQVQIGVLITDTDDTARSPNGLEIGEIGFYAGTTLFAVWSQASTFLFKKAAAFDVPLAYTLDISTLPAGAVTVSPNASKEGLESLILAHEAKADPHAQYVLEKIGLGKYDSATIYDLDARIIGDDGKTYRSLAANNVGFTPSTNPGKWTRWAYTLAELHADFIPTKTGVRTGSADTLGITRVTFPDGGTFAGAATTTGAIKIAFPTGTNALNNMVRMRVELWDNALGESFTLQIAGYVTSALAWSNQTVAVLGQRADRDFTVRFGNDGKPCIWIGELASTWTNLRVAISEVMVSFNSDGGSVDRWDSGWAISAATAFDTVEDTITGNLVFGQSDIARVAGLQTALNAKEASIAAGTAAQYWRGDKTWSDFFTDVRAATLTGLSLVAGTAVAAADTVLVAIGKLQKQITDLTTTVSGKEPTIAAGTTSQYWRGDKSWRDFFTDVRAATLTGIVFTANAAIVATDTVLTALGKLQAQLTAQATALDGKEPSIATGTTAQFWRGDKTWADVFASVRSATLTGLVTTTNAAIAATDTVLGALGKLQKQITDLTATVNTKEDAISNGTTAQFWRGDKTWQSLETAVRGTDLAGLSTTTNAAITATDTVLIAAGKLQKQVTDLGTAKQDVIAAGTAAQYWRGDKTWRDFFTDVRAATLTGLSLVAGTAVAAADTVLIAIGKLQKQITDLSTTKADLDSPIFTGNARAVTPAQFDNDTSVVTSAFVKTAGVNYSKFSAYDVSTVLPASVAGGLVEFFGTTGGQTLTLPLTSAVRGADSIKIFNYGTVSVSIVRQGTEWISYGGAGTLNTWVLLPGENLELVAGSGAWFAVGGSAYAEVSSLFGSSLTGNGYKKIPGGLVFQWAAIPAIAANSSVVVNFPVAFPNGLLAVALAGGATGAGTPGVNSQSMSATQVRFWNQSTSAATQIGTAIFIGY